MSAPTYPIGTIYQMADIPEEALSRFMAELPAIIAQIRHLRATATTFNEMFSGAFELNIEGAGDPTWIDDDKGEANISVAMPDGGKVVATRRMSGEPA